MVSHTTASRIIVKQLLPRHIISKFMECTRHGIYVLVGCKMELKGESNEKLENIENTDNWK